MCGGGGNWGGRRCDVAEAEVVERGGGLSGKGTMIRAILHIWPAKNDGTRCQNRQRADMRDDNFRPSVRHCVSDWFDWERGDHETSAVEGTRREM